MLIIISVPHQSNVTSQYFSSKQEFIDEQNLNDTESVPTFDEAIESFTHDLNTCLIIEDETDLNEAILYPTEKHRWAEIRAEAHKIKAEYFY